MFFPQNNPFTQQPQQILGDIINCVIEPQNSKGGLYIGQLEAASNIEHVLTVCIEASISYSHGINHKVIQCHDMAFFTIKSFFSAAWEFIDICRESGNILIHCVAGISRSASVVLSYLMKKQGFTLEQSLRYLKKIRPQIRPNPGFLKQLLELEREIFGGILSVLSPEVTPYYQIQTEPQYFPQQQLPRIPQYPLNASVQPTKFQPSNSVLMNRSSINSQKTTDTLESPMKPVFEISQQINFDQNAMYLYGSPLRPNVSQYSRPLKIVNQVSNTQMSPMKAQSKSPMIKKNPSSFSQFQLFNSLNNPQKEVSYPVPISVQKQDVFRKIF